MSKCKIPISKEDFDERAACAGEMFNNERRACRCGQHEAHPSRDIYDTRTDFVRLTRIRREGK